MDTMIQSYMEETDDLLQRAEECIIRLEMEYSSVDVNELFRIAHTIKGSSHMVGYGDIGNLMHKIEDMLYCARNGTIQFDQSIVSLCFEGLDTVKKMLQYKKEQGSEEIMESLVNSASRISEMIEVFIRVNKKEEEKPAVLEPEPGIISSLLCNKLEGKNKFYITFFIEEEAPMVSPVIIMILNCVDEIGVLVYSSVGDGYFSGSSCDNNMKFYNIIISTDIEEAELYTIFALFYIEKINIVDLSRNRVEENDFSFIDDDDFLYVIILKALMQLYSLVITLSQELDISKKDAETMKCLYNQADSAFSKMKNTNLFSSFSADFNGLYSLVIKKNNRKSEANKEFYININERMKNLMERAYNFTKGKHIFSIFKSDSNSLISRLNNFIGMLNKTTTLILLIDLSKLTILNENEVKDLIDIKKLMEAQNIEVGIIAEGQDTRKIINIFDAIEPVEEFYVYRSQWDAISGIFSSEDCFKRICKRVEDVQYGK